MTARSTTMATPARPASRTLGAFAAAAALTAGLLGV